MDSGYREYVLELIISKQWTISDLAKIEVVNDWPRSRNTSELRGFLGLAELDYYQVDYDSKVGLLLSKLCI